MFKKVVWVFGIQFLLLSTLMAYWGKSIAAGDAVSPIADFGFWEVWSDSLRIAFLAALIAAFTYWLVQILVKRHFQLGYLGCLLLTIIATIGFLVLDIFIVRDLSLVPVFFSVLVSHILSWMVLVGSNRLKGAGSSDG